MSYDGLIPVPPHLWHLTILSPFLRVPLPSQFLQGASLVQRYSSSCPHGSTARMCGLDFGPGPFASATQHARACCLISQTLFGREYALPVVLHVDHHPVVHRGHVQGLVETAERRVPVVGI